MKEADYKKIFPIAKRIDDYGSVTPSEAKELCEKSETPTWRYLKMLVDTGYVISEGDTNSIVYKRNVEEKSEG